MDDALLEAVGLSLKVAACVVVLGAPIALALGYLLARRNFRGKSLVSALLLLPLVMPPVVTGYALLVLFGRQGPLGGLGLSFSFGAAVVAALTVGLPLYVMSVRSAFEGVDVGLEQVAATLGEAPRPVFFRVTLPLAMPGVAAGALLAFGRALGEFGATAVLAGNIEGETRTIPLAVFSALARPGGEAEAASLALASLIASLFAALGYEMLWSRRTR